MRREIKHQIIAGINKNELVLLKFTNAEKAEKLTWKHSKEFAFEGEMYDIVETEIHGDTTYYSCWWDHEETKLNKQLTKLLADAWGNNPQRRERQDQIFQFYKSLYFQIEINERQLHAYSVKPKTHHHYILQVGFSSPPFHPPNLA